MEKKAYQTPVMEMHGVEMSPIMNLSSPLHTNADLYLNPKPGDANVSRSRRFDLFVEEEFYEPDEFWLSDN